jgi:uncharacterized protein (TIGR02646 family)
MIHITKDLSKVPTKLTDKKTDFENAITSKKYQKESYKVVQKNLIDLYNDKCAYCETSLKNNFRAVEHYRPKNSNVKIFRKCDTTHGYYWLALSWSNLVLSCSYCNSYKGCCFDIKNTAKRVGFNNETFETIHAITKQYNKDEEPLLIHPEIDKPEAFIAFDINGKIKKNNPRISYTVDICKLNRDDLIELRMTILNEFRKKLNTSFNTFEASKSRNLISFQAGIKDFFCGANSNKSSFTAWRRYILKNHKQFLFKDDNEHFNTIVELALFKYKVLYCEVHRLKN